MQGTVKLGLSDILLLILVKEVILINNPTHAQLAWMGTFCHDVIKILTATVPFCNRAWSSYEIN